MNKTRLLKLARLLETVPPRKFDMGTWGESTRPADVEPQCATKACALGWATAIPEFKAAGLALIADPYWPRDAYVALGDLQGVEAGRKFFNLTAHQAERLFLEGENGPKEKAKEIRAMVRAAV